MRSGLQAVTVKNVEDANEVPLRWAIVVKEVHLETRTQKALIDERIQESFHLGSDEMIFINLCSLQFRTRMQHMFCIVASRAKLHVKFLK
jgi:hypothetical protein